MMRVLIVEDEAPAVRRLKTLLQEIDSNMEVVAVLDSIESSVKWLAQNGLPDLIFMDIHLSDGNSFLIFEQTEVKSPVIFATAYDEYAVRAFKVNSIDYLLKPIEKGELERALSKYRLFSGQDQHLVDMREVLNSIKSGKKEYKQRFLVKSSDRLIPVPADQVRYFCAEDKVVFLQTEDKKYIIDFTLDQLEELLDPKKFFRLNRKYVGQMNCIDKIFYHLNGKLKLSLLPNAEEEVFVSREKANDFKAWLES